MSLLDLAERKRSQVPGNAALYRRKFVETVCEVVAAGFARLNAASLAVKEEPAVTGLLVDQMRAIVQSRDCPIGAENFSIHDDRPESGGEHEGKHRPRVDIVVEQAVPGPRPIFQFEAKRMNSTGSVAAYLGDDGLGCFLSSKYGKGASDAGMLGYVQSETPQDWSRKIETKLDQERSIHQLDAVGTIWHKETSVPSLAHLFRTKHTRDGDQFDVFHILLACA